MNPGGRGEQFKLLELSDRGLALLAGFGVSGPAGHGRGGIVHQWWAKTLTAWLTDRGLTAEIEESARGARVDILGILPDGQEIAVEIEMGEGHAVENIRKDLAAGFKRVVCLLADPKSEPLIRRKLGDLPQGVVIGDLKSYEATLTSVLSALRRPNQNEERRGRRARRDRPAATPVISASAPPLFEPGAYSTPLAADYLGLSPATLETMRVRGGRPPFSKLGRRVV